ncbi:MAG: YeeE/YedE family protein [Flavobacteriales bacterium]
MLELLRDQWPWYIGGPLIAMVMSSLLYFGKTFGISSTLRTFCTIGGAAKFSELFQFDWKTQKWNLAFIFGVIGGGYFASTILKNADTLEIAPSIINELNGFGIQVGNELVPSSIFSFKSLMSLKGFLLIVIGGFLVGFGSRYAGGCTSGHAITGLSDLQLPSFIAVIGFYHLYLICKNETFKIHIYLFLIRDYFNKIRSHLMV